MEWEGWLAVETRADAATSENGDQTRAALETVATGPAGWLDERTEEQPNSVAVTFRGVNTTNAELLDRARSYTDTVLEATNGCPGVVPVVMESNVESFAANIGVLRAGSVAVPIELSEPRERRNSILERVNPELVLTSEPSVLDSLPKGLRGVLATQVRGEGADGVAVDPDSPARVVFTSGSTGVPKGIIISHAALALLTSHGARSPRPYGASDRLSMLHSFSFAASHRATFGSLRVGARLCIYDVRADGLVDLPDWLAREEITVLHTTPNLLRAVLRVTSSDLPDSIRLIRVGADRLLPEDLREFQQRMPESCHVAHTYASTEFGLISVAGFNKDTPVHGDRVAGGRPLADVSVRIVDDHGQLVPHGHAGNVEVAGPGPRPRPFIDRATMFTAPREPESPSHIAIGDRARFLPDGQLELVGRSTARVKVRGYGVDLNEVETALVGLESVRQAAVVLDEQRRTPRLVAHVVSADGGEDWSAIRAALAASLPEYSIPAVAMWWKELPLTSRGKVDKLLMLEKSAFTDVQSASAGTPVDLEDRLLDIWRRVLETATIGAEDDFFEVGGDSLSAYELVAAIRTGLDLDLAPASLLRARTVREQAELIRSGGGERGERLVEIRAGEEPGSIVFVHGGGGGILFAEMIADDLPAGRPIYGLQVDDPSWLFEIESMEELAELYTAEVLGTGTDGPITLVGWSLGGMIAWDMAVRLEQVGVDVAGVMLIDTRTALTRHLMEPTGGWLFQLKRKAHLWRYRSQEGLHRPGDIVDWLRGGSQWADEVEGDEPGPIRRHFDKLTPTWTPDPASFDVAVLGVEGTDGHHSTVWAPPTNGRFTLGIVRSAEHLDLVGFRRSELVSFLVTHLEEAS